MAPPNENKLETIRFRTTTADKAEFKDACSRMGFEMSDILQQFIKRFAKDPMKEVI